MSDPLYLLEIRLDAAQTLRVPRGARSSVSDLGYLVHGALTQAFGSLAPKPFIAAGTIDRSLRILAYSHHAPEELHERVAARGASAAASRPIAATVRGKRMPERFHPSQRLRFEVRACPVIRKSSDRSGRRAGAEVDVFLAEVEKVPAGVRLDRQEVYRTWLATTMGRGGVRCATVGVRAIRRLRLARRNSERRLTAIDRPDITFEGVLEVLEPDTFRTFLSRGVGRHRAFGFGMLLLRPA